MLKALKFVRGAVAVKDFVPALNHFHINGGTIRGYNGMLGLCCPISLDLDIQPNAVQFTKALQNCREDPIQLHMTSAGRLSVKSGRFKAFVDCHQDSYPEVVPEGETIALDHGIVQALKTLFPFIADDASRSWARGILFRGQSAFATTNINLIEFWLGYDFPVAINIPKTAVAELIRIGEEPESMRVTESSVTFHYAGDKWLRTQTYSTEWPDLGRIFNKESKQTPLSDKVWDAAEDLASSVDELGRLFFTPGLISTSPVEGQGSSIEVPEIVTAGCFNVKQFLMLKGVMTTIDLTASPAPCLFLGDNIRGAIIGMRHETV